jgi:uncharacterized protein (DUF934 family)
MKLVTPGDHALLALLTLPQWQAARDSWRPSLPVDILLDNTDDVLSLADDVPRLSLVVLQFPKWTDGRAYSQARLLRSRLAFGGELRATGDVVVDMLPLLARTGFGSVVLRADTRGHVADEVLQAFSGHYQSASNAPEAKVMA